MYSRLKLSNQQQDAEKLNQVKSEICYAIKRIAMRNGWDQKMLARQIGTSQTSISRVIRLRLEDLTINQLFRYLAILEPNFKILISI